MEFKRTPLVSEIEKDLRIRSLPIFLRDKYHGGWSYRHIAEILGCSPSTVARWMMQLGYSTRQMAALAWEQGLAPTVPYEAAV